MIRKTVFAFQIVWKKMKLTSTSLHKNYDLSEIKEHEILVEACTTIVSVLEIKEHEIH